MAKEYLQVNGQMLMTEDGKLIQVPDSENLNDLADTNSVMATQSETTSNEIEDLIVNGVIDGSPRGVYDNLSALQTAYPSGANGVYVTTDNGHWYYWNGTAWTDGGVYQSTEIANGSIIPEKLKDSVFSPLYKKNEVVFTKDNINATHGMYTAPNTIVDSSHYCIELDITNRNGYLSFDVSETLPIDAGYLIFDDNTSSSLKYNSLTNIPLKNIKKLQFNFLTNYTNGFTITYYDDFRDSMNNNLGFNNIEKTKTFNISNTLCNCGYYNSTATLVNTLSHRSCKIPVNNQSLKLTYEVITEFSFPFVIVEYNNGTKTILDNSSVGVKTYTLINAKYLYFNFFLNGGYTSEYTIETVEDNSNVNLPFGKTITKNINSFELYQANAFIDNICNINTNDGRNIYKIYLNGVSKFKFLSATTTPTVPIGILYDEENNIISILNSSNLDVEKIINPNSKYYILANGWDRTTDNGLNKEITITYANVEYQYENSVCVENKYNHCVNKPYSFSGKTAYFFGDSITEGFTNGSTITQNNYVKNFSNKVSLNYTNYGKGGSLFTRGKNEVQSIIDKIKGTDLSSADIIFIAGGVNDWQLGVTKE